MASVPLKKNFLRRIYQKLNSYEKKLILLCLIAIGVSFFLKWKFNQPSLKTFPAQGGIYTEGVLADNAAILDKTINRLTKSGLLRFDEKMTLQPALAKSWQIDAEDLSYTFTLYPQISAQAIAKTLQEDSDFSSQISVSVEGKKIQIKTEKPIGSLINNLTAPIFNFGPYNISQKDNNKLVLTSNPNWTLGQPYINKIIIRFYQNEDKLLAALRDGEIQGATGRMDLKDGFQHFSIYLQRYLTIFFNLSVPKIQDRGLREAIRDDRKYAQPIELTLTTLNQPFYIEKAAELKQKLAKDNITLKLKYADNRELKEKIIPARDYELLLYGLEIGRDPDIYPYYHSSQISAPGKNLSQYFNLAADKLLDEAHREIDPKKRLEETHIAQEVIDKDIPSIRLEQIKTDYFISKDVKGVKIKQGVTEADRFNNIWEWYLKVKKVKN